MKTSSHRLQRRSGGYALLLVLVFLGISTMLLTTIMNWTSETARLTDRQNEYYTSADAAEAAT
jgi:Tfp pilus assembly protein PilX